MKHKIILYLTLIGSFFSISAQNKGIKEVAPSSEKSISFPSASVLVFRTIYRTSNDLEGLFKSNTTDKKTTKKIVNY
jgi:TonB-dependent starch-binding outer membrane protein SusC